jgi:MoaA/NifB/PqqE/SkfB family radical SAM enzyme
LADSVPLAKPLVVHVDLTNMCNLRCEFCHLVNAEKKAPLTISVSDFQICLDKLSAYYGSVKVVSFGISGEPTVVPHLPDMIGYVSHKCFGQRIDMFTNAVPINRSMADKLVSAGLTHLRIAINGLSKEDYEKFTGRAVDFDSLIKNLTYLYGIRGDMKIYIKILDYMVKTEERRKRFFDMFEHIADWCGVQNVVTLDGKSNITGACVRDIAVCPQPFYNLTITQNGDILPCCGYTPKWLPPSLGNLLTDEVCEIHAAGLRLQEQMLRDRAGIPGCRDCQLVDKVVNSDEDYLDDNIPAVLKRYERKKILCKAASAALR